MKTKTLPWAANGSTYCTGSNGERICTGSQMGRRDCAPPDAASVRRLHLRRVPFVDGCYDSGGAYWGSPANLFCAWGDSDTAQAVAYFRADSRDEAKARTLTRFPAARFYR